MGTSKQTLAPWNRQRDSALGMGSDPLNRSRRPPGFKRRCLGKACRRATDAMHTVLPQASPQMPPLCEGDGRRTGPALRVHRSYRDGAAIEPRLYDPGLRGHACDAKAATRNDPQRALELLKYLGSRHPQKRAAGASPQPRTKNARGQRSCQLHLSNELRPVQPKLFHVQRARRTPCVVYIF